MVILIHEYQVFALSLHFLISLGSVQGKKGFKKLLKFYYPLIIPIFLIIIFFGNQVQFENLSEILKKFNIELNPYLGGGLYHYIGGFYKWHFFYFSYRDFINLFFSFILSILIFYVLFDYLIIDLDHENYEYTTIGRPNKANLWIMARSHEISPKLYNSLVEKAVIAGYDKTKIEKVEQNWSNP